MKVGFSSHPRAYIRRDVSGDLFGTDDLTAMEELAYRRLVDLTAKHGPLKNDDKFLAAETKAGRAWKAAKDKLIETGRLVVEDGMVRTLPAYDVHEPVVRADVTTHEWRLRRADVLERDGHVCRYCGSAEPPIECDHVVPVARGGTSDPDNLCACCKPCNASKGAKTLEEWKGRQ